MDSLQENKAIGRLTELLALERGYSPRYARLIGNAAVLHDIGKTKIPKEILDKPGKLTAQEFEIIKNHTKLGLELLADIHGGWGDIARLICLMHHEWLNPSLGGYWGVPAYCLPDYVSFVSVSDVYVSLINERPYKEAWPPGDALGYIQEQAGSQFRPELAKEFISLIHNDSRVPAIFNESR